MFFSPAVNTIDMQKLTHIEKQEKSFLLVSATNKHVWNITTKYPLT